MAQRSLNLGVSNWATVVGTRSGTGPDFWDSVSFDVAVEDTISRYVGNGQWTVSQGNLYRSTAKAAYNAARSAPAQVQLEAQWRQQQLEAAQADYQAAWTVVGNLPGRRESWRARASLANNGIQYGPRRRTGGEQERSRSRSRSAERGR